MEYLRAKIEEIFEHAKPNIVVIGLLCTLGFPIYYIVWTTFFPQTYENLNLRLFCAFLGIPWVFYHYLGGPLKQAFPIYFLCSCCILMPFFFSYMLLMSGFSVVWVMSTMAGLFLLVLLIYDWMLILTLVTIGALLAYSVIKIEGGAIDFSQLSAEHIPIFLFAFFGGVICNHRRHQIHLNTVEQADALEDEVERRTRDLARKISELNAERKKVESANQAKSKFLAMMSHELKNPMNGIVGVSSLLRKGNLSQDQLEYVSILEESSAMLNALLDDILSYSKLDSGQRTVKIESFSLQKTVRALVGLVEPRANEKGMTITVDIASYTPDTLRGDLSCFRQVLLNLLTNSIKFSDHGEIKVQIFNNAEDLDEVELEVSVLDYGIGIAACDEDKIFAPFRQVDETVSRNYEGAGLGLSICKRLLNDIGGEIDYVSELGKGCNFFFHQRFEELDASELVDEVTYEKDRQEIEVKTSPAETLSPANALFDWEGISKVLVVDDNEMGRLTIARLLEHKGLKCTEACDGIDAIEQLVVEDFDLILMDINMPRMNGLEATMAIRELDDEHKSNLPIVGVTGNIEESEENYIKAGMTDILLKPFDLERLEAVLQKQTTSSCTGSLPA